MHQLMQTRLPMQGGFETRPYGIAIWVCRNRVWRKPPNVLPTRKIWGYNRSGTYDMIQEALMRAVPIAAITFAALFLSSGLARADGTWCAQYGTDFSGKNCGFYSFEQCRASVSGIGGFCQRNTFSANAAEPRRRHRRDN